MTGIVRASEDPQDPIPDARVTVFVDSLSFFKEVRSDQDGRYTAQDVPPGIYRLGCARRDFGYEEIQADVEDGVFRHDFFLSVETEPGRWDIIGTTAPEFLDATDIAFLLPGGNLFFCHDTTDPIVFDPIDGSRRFPDGSPSEQGCMNGSLLADGRVIMMGGQSPADPGNFRDAIRWVKAFDPETDQWEVLPDMQHERGRWYPGLSRLSDGSFLVMGGGQRPNAERTATCERFDLATQTWRYTGSMLNPSEFPPSALLHTGEVLATWSPPQLYNPASGAWRPAGDFNQPNRSWPGHSDHSLVVLADGRALAIGVVRGPDGNEVMGEIYDPDAEAWSLTSNPELVRFQSEVVQLPDGRVLVAGGETEVDPPPVEDTLGIVKWSDLYDPSTNSWRRVTDMNHFREYHGVTLLLPDGRVATTGGTRIKFRVGPTSADIEAFVPPYLLRGVRPEITEISTIEPPRGGRVTLGIAPETQITDIVLMGVESTTHWVSGGIPRRLVLSVQQSGSVVTTTLPSDPNVLPLGFYMLFAMVDDIPSEAVIVQVFPAGPCVRRPEWICDGDVDGDGQVNPVDAGLVQSAFCTAETCTDEVLCQYDLDCDHQINPVDAGIVQSLFGACDPPRDGCP